MGWWHDAWADKWVMASCLSNSARDGAQMGVCIIQLVAVTPRSATMACRSGCMGGGEWCVCRGLV